ncbi:AAA family ATPase [Geobacter sulfurreducens]|uniref:AAA family ATPase n=1 Tax=Geobacter sulfurreducens TaxID=35554 RepID=UPI002CAC4B92|nr:AAA family ATPase [Geobacter sulfurreducens]HML78988.1 AAA family ATPase [Geobacter sulfurreducens]
MINKISIGNLAVFQGFDWDKEVVDEQGKVCVFKSINVIYGRNYSGKTSLSRILRAMETGELSDKYQTPSFFVTFVDGSKSDHNSLKSHGKMIRVFNEDFVRENLRFITNPDDSIEPFAILGDDNNKIEKEIETLESELGSNEGGKETGLYAQQAAAKTEFNNASKEHKKANDALEKQLGDKATDRNIGIKYKPERFGDQNYTIQKLKIDIKNVLDANYRPPNEKQLAQYEKLINEKTLQPIPPFRRPGLNVTNLADKAEALVTKKISESDKIEELVKDAVMNRWVNDGRTHHNAKRANCAFCGNPISEDRWAQLEKHFDEESEKLERDIVSMIAQIEAEKSAISSALSISNALFYSSFHGKLDELEGILKDTVRKYNESLDTIIAQLRDRKDDILTQKKFQHPFDISADLEAVWNSYEKLCGESDSFSTSLGKEQTRAREALRLKEVSDYLLTIRYQEQISSIMGLKEKYDNSEREKSRIEGDIRQKVELISSKKRELNDEEKGARKVNEFLNNFFGHKFLSLEAKNNEVAGEDSKRIRFEVIRDGKKAYHLSEGECSLLAFCYFLAKLDDIDTRDSKPIIWIDDPISSLDSNHIFFIYSLISQEIVNSKLYSQLFISTHNLDFLKYLKRLPGAYQDERKKEDKKHYQHFIIERNHSRSIIRLMPKYLKEYVTEFNYLFHQIHKCAAIESIDDTNYTTFYNFGNNSRKFFEIYLYYKYPDQGMTEETLRQFFGEDKIPTVLTDRINNEYSHLCGVFERGATPVEVPEMQNTARQIIERLKEDKDQFSALLKSIGIAEEDEVGF